MAFARPVNLFLITGSVSGIVVLDCDDEKSLRWWTARLGDALRQTARVRTSRGYHFYFRLPEGRLLRNRSHHGGGEQGEWDIRGEGGGVIVPPSVHESGRVYEWVEGHGPEAIVEAPPGLFDAPGGGTATGPDRSRSMLAHLLAHPPSEGGRNVWLAQVAGHFARHIPWRDAYESLVRLAANSLADPLPDSEVDKLIPSIWSKEKQKAGNEAPPLASEEDPEAGDAWRRNLVQPTEDTGWLASGGVRILCQVRSKQNGEEGSRFELELAPFCDCDIRVVGVLNGERGRLYSVEVYHPDGEVREDMVLAGTVADLRRLTAWLAEHGASIGPPDNIWPTKIPPAARMLRYFEAQDAPHMVTVPALGWNDDAEAFICHEGLIRPGERGIRPFEGVRPEPRLKGWAPYRYGFSDEATARSVLRTCLEFHHPEVAAVFGAWWAACFIKPQLRRIASQFPFMALEAASESGKTTGFFSLMLALSGNATGQTNSTRAALRDYLRAHRSGIVWLDDLDDLDAHGELLRNVTVGGSLIKKGEDHDRQVVATLEAALCITGEALGLRGQKALVDRAVMLDVPSPTRRRSLHGDYPQWDDIVEFRNRYPDLTEHAGTLVQMALNEAPAVLREFKALRTGTSRYADKTAIIRAGARLLAALSGEEWVIERADAWALEDAKRDTGAENALTLKLLPMAMERTGWRQRPVGPDGRAVATPVFIEPAINDRPATIWFSPKLLAAWWQREPPLNKHIEQRTESETALIQQAKALGWGGRKGSDPLAGRRMFKYATGEGNMCYWRVPDEFFDILMARSRGIGKEDP